MVRRFHQRGRGGFFLCLNKCQWFSGFGATDDLDTQVDGGCPFMQLCNQRCNEHKNNAILGKNAHNSTVSAKTGFPFKYSSPACKRRQSQQLDWWGDDPKTPQICGLSIVCPDLYRYHIWQWIIGLKLSIICCLSIIFLIIIILTYDRYMNHGYHWLHCNLSIIGRILVIGLFFGHFVQ